MSLDPVNSGLGGRLPADKVPSTATATENVQSATDKPIKKLNKPVKQVTKTAKPVTEPVMPGEFPSEDGPREPREPAGEVSFTSIWSSLSQWFSGLAPQAFDAFEWGVQWLVNRFFPPPKQAQMYEAALKRPFASTFVVCQLVCCGVPLLVFLAGVFLFAAVAMLLWAVLSLLILGPILLVASMMGVSLWGWGWIVYGLVKWVDQRFLGGMITRFWLPRMQAQGGEEEESQEEKKED
ncbi:uncharacterized protein N7459_004363 [Penicillium hispanicum]|uniref:uncharacterized protein n=1 Tax=Penicillium hispanicum TaxID=1080232 RepID=UPI002541A208|nr:uncharacterized protein N7459_004363 [Penicillium hispanicum]KAJ5584563.1 hypothetical protein N7459_004363 [Penicillium hispanicum]